MKTKALQLGVAVAVVNVALGILGAVLLPPSGLAAASDPNLTTLEQTYQRHIRQLLARYCHECHSEDRTEADIDFGDFITWADVRKHPETWQKVSEMLESSQMPPKKARQPSDAERIQLRQWLDSYLAVEAKSRAGDPGRVMLRRLSNAQYTYTLRDLTGIDALDPAHDFPADGAAGEGFTNTGNALVMSPVLITKYLNAAKEVASHAVLLPTGFRFSPHTSRRDWTEETLAQIREFYREFTDPRGAYTVNLQGIVFDTNQGGRLPLERYLAATIAERESLMLGHISIDTLAAQHGLNAKYLTTLWHALTSRQPSLLLDVLRRRWRNATLADVAVLANDIAAWQKGLWKFTTVGHIGKAGGPKRWLEPVSPLLARQDIRFNIPASSGSHQVVLSLSASDAGDGNENDFVVWQEPRLVAPGRPDLLLRDVRQVSRSLLVQRRQVLAATAKFLHAAAEARAANDKADVGEVAQKYGIEADVLSAWLDYLGIGSSSTVPLHGHFTNKLQAVAGYEFIQGWGRTETPFLLVNSSDQHVRIPGNMQPHSVAVHPSPTLHAAVGWCSPVTATFEISAAVTHAHPECGNGVTWLLELRRGAMRHQLATGIAQGAKEVKIDPIKQLVIRTGDCVSLLVGPRDGNHACDLTTIALKITSTGNGGQSWDLATDISGNVLAGNPHPDRAGHQGIWHFYAEADTGGTEVSAVIPPGSLLAGWLASSSAIERDKVASKIQKLLTAGPPSTKRDPDALLYEQLTSLSGPLFGRLPRARTMRRSPRASQVTTPVEDLTDHQLEWGLDPAMFGKHTSSGMIDDASLYVHAPSTITFRLPAELVTGCELVTSGVLDHDAGALGSVQFEVTAGKLIHESRLLPSQVVVTVANGQWTANNQCVSYATPIIVNDGTKTQRRIEAAFDDFRRLFPPALCYTKIVPVDEVVTLTLFYREDDYLSRLMLDQTQQLKLDRLWDELHYISQDALTLVDAFTQLMEYATQDADPRVFEPLRKPINDRATAFKKHLIDTEPGQLNALLDFASQAYRRPLAAAESRDLRTLYTKMRDQGIPHDEAFRLLLARLLVAPAFLYRIEKPVVGAGQGPVSDWELAGRLSYFLWSTQPDRELYQAAAQGQLHNLDTLLKQARRMLRDARTRQLAVEFACHWLHIADFDHLDEKSERHFPTFAGLRSAMYEESIQFFTDLFQNDGSVLDILNADHTFLNEPLARHYGIPLNQIARPAGPSANNRAHPEWRRVSGLTQYRRGGILGQATTLAKQSGASRTSPILRGNWISEVLLGERLPRPPKGVPVLPNDEALTEGLTIRQLVEKHTKDGKCAVCHRRIDPLGFSLEGFDAIGRWRDKDLGGRPIDTHVRTVDGAQFEGLDGLRTYLITARRDAFLRQFCRKLLGYALGRSIQLSDEPLLAEMQSELKARNYHINSAFEAVIRSRQFREIRGLETAYND
jgi:hypothetical protein